VRRIYTPELWFCISSFAECQRQDRDARDRLTAEYAAANSPAHSPEMRRRGESSAQTVQGGPWATMRELLTENPRWLPRRACARETASRFRLSAPALRSTTGGTPRATISPAGRTRPDTHTRRRPPLAQRNAPVKVTVAYQPRRHTDVRLGLEGRSKSRMKGSLATSSLIVSTSTSMRIHRLDLCNAASMWIGNAATPLAICHDVVNATHGTHGV